MSKNLHRVLKRDRERAVELKRKLKREKKQAAAAAKKDGTFSDDPFAPEQPPVEPQVP